MMEKERGNVEKEGCEGKVMDKGEQRYEGGEDSSFSTGKR